MGWVYIYTGDTGASRDTELEHGDSFSDGSTPERVGSQKKSD